MLAASALNGGRTLKWSTSHWDIWRSGQGYDRCLVNSNSKPVLTAKDLGAYSTLEAWTSSLWCIDRKCGSNQTPFSSSLTRDHDRNHDLLASLLSSKAILRSKNPWPTDVSWGDLMEESKALLLAACRLCSVSFCWWPFLLTASHHTLAKAPINELPLVPDQMHSVLNWAPLPVIYHPSYI